MYRQAVDTKYAANTGTNLIVSSSSNFQNTLNAAQPGETITLDMGVTFTGNFTVPPKPPGAPIIVRAATLTPENVRVYLERGFPKLLTPNAGAALTFLPGSRGWRFINLEFGLGAGVLINHGIVRIGNNLINQLADLPDGIIFDRCLVHGNDIGDCTRGIELNGATCAVVDSSVFNIHGGGLETQAICGWNGSGPYKIDNCFLQGATENFMIGGADPAIQNLVPADLQFTRNHCQKPLSWKPTDPSYAGKHWSVKNLFELKNTAYALVEGNTFENNWADAQDGTAILFTPRNQYGTAPWVQVKEITFRDNEIINSPNGMLILGTDYNSPSQRTTNVKVENNLYRGISGRWVSISDTCDGLTIDHNTAINGGNVLTLSGNPQNNFRFTRNIAFHNDYGIIGTDRGPGRATIDTYLPGATITDNVLVGTPEGYKSSYPNNLFAADLAAVGFNSAYKPSGPYLDYGADIDAIERAKRGAVVVPPPTLDLKARILAAAEATYAQIQVDKKLGSTSKRHQLIGARKIIDAIKLVN